MRGDLSETSAADACRAIAGNGSTGVLMIDGPEGSGTVTLLDGAIAGATSPVPRARLGDRLVGAGFLAEADLRETLEAQRESGGRMRLGALLVERTAVPRDAIRLFVQEQALDALFELVRWRYGAFDFVSGTPSAVPEIPIVLRVDDALLEVARRHQQWDELSAVIPDLESVPVFCEHPTSASASLEPDEFAVLASVDGERSIRGLAADLGYGEFELARIVYGLALLGVVEVRLPEDEIGSAFDDAFASLGQLLDPTDDIEAPVEDVEVSVGDAGADLDAMTHGRIVESDLPDRSTSDILPELRGLDAQVASDAEHSAQPAPVRSDDAVASRPSSGPRGDDDGDVAEFLRELSQLALDDEHESPPERPRRPPSVLDHREEDGRKKRRGLFGR